MLLRLKNRVLDLGAPVVMGVLNVTPDSFSDGGRFVAREAALAQARALVADGAAIVDIGGESTRPGAQPVSEAEELDRVVPLVERLARDLDCALSVDTMKPAVMRAAVGAGAGMINDVMALRAPGALAAARASGAAVCLMHMQGEPRTMQQAPVYADVVEDVAAFLRERAQACLEAGIPREQLVVDPGFGFGKALHHNLALLANIDVIAELGLPVLVGLSRKSMLGTLTGRPVDQRVDAGVAAAVLAVWQGARIVRTHDVRATIDALKVTAAAAAARTE